jgi:hypothetical protein
LRPPNFGDLFLIFHHSYLNRFNSWRKEFGYPPIIPWNPGDPIPTDQEILPGGGVTRGPSYTPVPVPPWFTVTGSPSGRPSNGLSCASPTGQEKLFDFPNRNVLGCALVTPFHNTVHVNVGGSMGGTGTAPRDGIFWRWHKHLDGIHINYVSPPFVRIVDIYPMPIFPYRITSPDFVSFVFSGSMTGVTAGTVRINGFPATVVSGSGPGPYVFSGFPPAGIGPMSLEILSGSIVDSLGNPYPGESFDFEILDPGLDLDGDGLNNGAEVETHHTNPGRDDTDHDGITDYGEVQGGSDPLDPNDPVSHVGHHMGAPPVSAIMGSPNPFGENITLYLAVPTAGRVTVRIHDVSGRLVRTLLDADIEASNHTLVWDGRDGRHRRVPAGIYFAKATTPGGAVVTRMVRGE